MTAVRQDFTIEKKSKFRKEFQILEETGLGKDLTGKKMACKIKESTATDTVLHDLTEANGGVEVLDDSTGQFALYIPADETNVTADYAVYDIVEIDEAYPDTENDVVMYGKISYRKGIV